MLVHLAVRYLRPFCDLLEERKQRFYLSSIAPMLGRELCALGRYDEAEQAADQSDWNVGHLALAHRV